MYHNIMKRWNAHGYGHAPSSPPARTRGEQQARFTLVAPVRHQLVVICLLTRAEGAWAGSTAHLLNTASKAQNPPSWDSKEIQLHPSFPHHSPIHHERSYGQTLTLLQGSCSCRQCCDSLTFCWQGGGKVVYVIPSPRVPGLLGMSKISLLWVSRCHWNNVPRAVRGWDGSDAILPAAGWQQARAGLCPVACQAVLKVEEGVFFWFCCCLGFFFGLVLVFFFIFLALEISSKENISLRSVFTLQEWIKTLELSGEKYPPLTSFNGAS